MDKGNQVRLYISMRIRYQSLIPDTQLEALLKAIAHKIIPGIPENLRILLVDQVEDHVDEGGSSASQLTVTQTVVKSDRRREIAMKEHDRTRNELSYEIQT